MIRAYRRFVLGMTLVELLVVTVLLAIATAIAIPLYESSRRHASLDACRANIVAIYQAEEAYRVRNRRYTTNINLLAPMMGGGITCPTGAAYRLESGSQGIESSIAISCTSSGDNRHSVNPEYTDGAFTRRGAY
jgi:prepilin-type N-terminal cleavage/methylation domain-containing protein